MRESEKMLLQAEAKNAVKQVRNAKTDEDAVEFIGRLLKQYYHQGYGDGYDYGWNQGYDNGADDGSMGLV